MNKWMEWNNSLERKSVYRETSQEADSGLGWGHRECGESKKCKRDVEERRDRTLLRTDRGSSWDRKERC